MLSLRKYLDKIVLTLILMFLWIILCGVLVEKKVSRKKIKPQQPLQEKSQMVLPIIFMACNRKLVSRSIVSLVSFRGQPNIFPIFVCQDCISHETYEIITTFTHSYPNITVLPVPKPTPELGRHYKFALNHVFRTLKHKAAVVIDEGLDVSRDFFEYFLATSYLFEKDSSIWCVSAWNDNCKHGLVDRTEVSLLHRTEHFPGMGWMITSKTWDEIDRVLPKAFFASYLNNVIPRGHVCIRPEISRTINFGPNALAKERHLSDENGKRIFYTGFVQFTQFNLSYLLQEHEHLFVSFVYGCPETTVNNIISGNLDSSLKFVRITYSDVKQFVDTAKTLGLMDDIGVGIFRTALHGIVQCSIKGRRVFLAPASYNMMPKPSRSITNLVYDKS